MKKALRDLFMHARRKQTAFEVDEELQFHIEMLEHKYTQLGMSDAHAKSAALRRFGNFQRIRNECVKISWRNSLLRRVLKTASILMALTGLVLHLLSWDYRVDRVGTMLITIAISVRLLIYVRGLSPWTYLSGTETSLAEVTDTPKDTART